MKQFRSMSGLFTVITLLLGVIWLSPSLAVAGPTFSSLGQLEHEALRVPGAMDLDAAGNLYVADSRGGLVHKFSPYGELLQSFDLQGTGRGLAVTVDGTRLFVSREQSVVVADAAGQEIGTLSGAEVDAPEFALAGEIDIDSAGNVFVADVGSMQIKVYDNLGQYQSRFGSAGPNQGQFMQIGGMAINPVGQVVVADSSAVNGKVHVFTIDADLNVAGVVSYAKKSAASFDSPFMETPRGLTFDALGRGYFLDFKSSDIRVTSEAFVSLGKYSRKGDEAGQLINVIDAVFDDANDRLFVGCDTGRIVILGVDGGQNPVYSNKAPSSPTPQSPVGGSDVDSATPTLVFGNAVDADGDTLTYRVAVLKGDAVVFQTQVAADAGDATSVVVDVDLEENAAYGWTVQAFDASESSAVAASAFVVNAVDEAPEAPVLLTPANGASVAGTDLLSWTEPAVFDPNDYVSGYQVEISADDAFSDVVAAQAVTESTLALGAITDYPALEAGTIYFWRVSALDSGQLASEPSVAGQFAYDTTGLNVTANMPDAVVSFHGNHAYAGQFVGTTPLETRDLTPGTLSVVVKSPGFEPYVAQVTLTEGETVELYAELIPAMQVDKLRAKSKGINGRSGLSVARNAMPFVVDFDNDGDLDMLVGDDSGQITLFANMEIEKKSRLMFDQGQTLDLPVLPGAAPFVADWNNDGRKDLIVGQADGTVKLFINIGLEEAPAFGAGVDVQAAGSTLSVGSDAVALVVDYNGDGAKDLLIGNGSGQLNIFINNGDDSSPSLAAPALIMQLDGGVAPALVDWDANGAQDLLLVSNGAVNVYRQTEDGFKHHTQYSERRAEYAGVFAISLDNAGVDFIAGQKDGALTVLTSEEKDVVESFHIALQSKVDELAGLVADQSPELLGDVAVIGAQISTRDFQNANNSLTALAGSLFAGAAQVSALELAALCD